MASYVHALSGGCISPETEQYLLWELPLARGWAYYHAALCSQGAKTIKLGTEPLDWVARLRQVVAARLRNRKPIDE